MQKINQVSFSYYSINLFSYYFAFQSHYITNQVPVPDSNRENTKVIYQVTSVESFTIP